MKKAPRPGFALAAVFPAVMVPIVLPALRNAGASDLAGGLTVGVLLGLSILLIVLALRPRHAGGRC